jgi:hypothetical protein
MSGHRCSFCFPLTLESTWKGGEKGGAVGRHPVTSVAGFIVWGPAVEHCSLLSHGEGIIFSWVLKHSEGKEKVTLLMSLSKSKRHRRKITGSVPGFTVDNTDSHWMLVMWILVSPLCLPQTPKSV